MTEDRENDRDNRKIVGLGWGGKHIYITTRMLSATCSGSAFLPVLSPTSNFAVRYIRTFSKKRTPPVLGFPRAHPIFKVEEVPSLETRKSPGWFVVVVR